MRTKLNLIPLATAALLCVAGTAQAQQVKLMTGRRADRGIRWAARSPTSPTRPA